MLVKRDIAMFEQVSINEQMVRAVFEKVLLRTDHNIVVYVYYSNIQVYMEIH